MRPLKALWQQLENMAGCLPACRCEFNSEGFQCGPNKGPNAPQDYYGGLNEQCIKIGFNSYEFGVAIWVSVCFFLGKSYFWRPHFKVSDCPVVGMAFRVQRAGSKISTKIQDLPPKKLQFIFDRGKISFQLRWFRFTYSPASWCDRKGNYLLRVYESKLLPLQRQPIGTANLRGVTPTPRQSAQSHGWVKFRYYQFQFRGSP